MKRTLLTLVVTTLLATTAFAGPIHDAARKGDIKAVKQHLAAGRNVNAKDDKGRIPLHRAAREGHTEVAELLIANGAYVNAKDKEGKTPLYHAARWGHKNTTALLIAAGADVNAKDDKGRTPLDRAVGYTEIVALLRKHGGRTAQELKALMPRLSDIRTYWEPVQLAELVINGKVGLKYEVLYSSDLKKWHVLDTITIEASPQVYVDKSAEQCPHWCLQPMRFYRVKLVE